jgi:hypothetical protein
MKEIAAIVAACSCVLLISAAPTYSRGSVALERRLYELVTTTNMPHLEENLRYTEIREERCLGHEDLATAFSALRHPALKGCKLGNETRDDNEALHYELACKEGNGTKGKATWRITESGIVGVLSLKMGGKNLTFGQRIDGKSLGACSAI